MIEVLRNTFKHTFIYSLGNLMVKVAGLILLPLYTTKLTTTEYGYLAIFEITATFLLIFLAFNINHSLMRWYADAQTDLEKKTVFSTTMFFVVLNIAFFNLFVHFFVDKISIVVFQTNEFGVYFNIFFVYVSLDVFNAMIMSLFRILEKSKLFITLNITKLLIIFTLNILFITKFSLGVKGILLATLIGNLFNTLFVFPIFLKNFHIGIDLKLLKPMLKYSIPLAFTSLSTLLLDTADRYILKFLTSDALVGLYSLAYKITGMLNFFLLQSFQLAFLPIAYKIYTKPDAPKIFSKTTTYLIMVLLFVGLGLAVFAKEFLIVFSPMNREFWEAAQYVPFLNIIVIFFALRFMYSLGFLISKKNIYQPIFVIAAVLVNIGLNFWLIPNYKIYGAIASSIFTSLILNVLYYIFSRKYYFVRYEMLKIWLLIGIAALLYWVSTLVDKSLVLSIVLKLFISATFPLIIYFGGFLNVNERRIVVDLLKNFTNAQYYKQMFDKIFNSNKSSN